MAELPDHRWVYNSPHSGVQSGRKYHPYEDCSSLHGNPDYMVDLTPETAEMFHIDLCSVCERRAARLTLDEALLYLQWGRFYSPQECRDALKEHGFVIIDKKIWDEYIRRSGLNAPKLP